MSTARPERSPESNERLISTGASPPEREWWRRAVLYQVYPRSFCDASGDGVGDLQGLISKLDAVQALGVDALWVCPVYRSPMEDFGYDIEDHYQVDPLFGSQEDMERLLHEAHARGLKVLLDLVISHTASSHAWFKESRQGREGSYSDYFVWVDPQPDGMPPNNWLSIFGGSAWQWETKRQQYYLHNFLSSQPDLNFHHPAVQDEVLAIARHWLDLGVDGFRLDTVNFYFHDRALRSNPPASERDSASAPAVNPYGWQDHLYDKNQPEVLPFIERLRALLDEYEGRVALGEIGESPARSLELLAEYTQPGRLHLCYSFDLLSAERSAAHFERVISRFEERAGESWPCWAFSNHDVTRAATRLCPPGGSVEATGSQLCALLLSLRGTPCLYQGDELALPESEVPFELLVDPYGIEFWPEFKGRDGCRTPYPWTSEPQAGFSEGAPWLPISDEHRERSFERQLADAQSPLSMTRQLLSARREQAALQSGSIELLERSGELLSFERRLGDERVRCFFNLSLEPARRELDERESEARLIIASAGVELGELLSVPAQGWALLKLS